MEYHWLQFQCFSNQYLLARNLLPLFCFLCLIAEIEEEAPTFGK